MDSRGITVAGIIMIMVVLLIGIAVYPTIYKTVKDTVITENITGAQKTLLELTPLMFVVGLLLAAVAWATKGGK